MATVAQRRCRLRLAPHPHSSAPAIRGQYRRVVGSTSAGTPGHCNRARAG
jgi:hypothetical protein